MTQNNDLTMEKKLKKINSISWELLGQNPRELKAQGISPINLVGATFSTKEMLNEIRAERGENIK